MGLAIDGHACPSVGYDLDVGGVDVGVFLDEVSGENGGKELRWIHGVLFCKD